MERLWCASEDGTGESSSREDALRYILVGSGTWLGEYHREEEGQEDYGDVERGDDEGVEWDVSGVDTDDADDEYVDVRFFVLDIAEGEDGFTFTAEDDTYEVESEENGDEYRKFNSGCKHALSSKCSTTSFRNVGLVGDMKLPFYVRNNDKFLN